MLGNISYGSISTAHQRRRWAPGRFTLAGAIVVAALMGVFAWWMTSTRVMDLSQGGPALSRLQSLWQQGSVVVMIRHAERCDQSSNPCLGPADGITVVGGQAAQEVGAGLRTLGLERARMLASPATRTRQTADRIGGSTVVTQDWVGECNAGFKHEVLKHKQVGENLVLMTHSGCIDHFQRKMGVAAGQRSSEYTQAFFVQVDGRHEPRILGEMDAQKWASLNVGGVK